MSSRPILSPYPVFNATTGRTMNASLTSLVTVIQNISTISYDISWTGAGSPVGTFSVQVSNTYAQNDAGGAKTTGNWTTLTLSSVPTVSTNTGNGAIEVDVTGFYAIRLVYNYVSGTGTLSATVNGKVQ